MQADAIELELKATNNREALKHTLHASCFSCIQTFGSWQVTVWVDYGKTAVCPLCGVDAVIPGIIPYEVLRKLNHEWFHIVRD